MSVGATQDEVLRGYDPYARAALAPFGFRPETSVRLLSLSENATYKLDEPGTGRTAVLRVHRTGYHPPGAVASELAWMQALRAEEGLLTPGVYRSADGREVVEIEIGGLTRQTVLFEWLPGTEPPEDRLTERFELLGGICARMHRHSRVWRRPPDFVRFDWDYDCCVGRTPRWGRWQDGVGVGPRELATLGRAADLMERRLARFGQGPERFGLIHSDVRLANLLADGDALAVIDFDDSGFGWFLFDFATAVSFIEHEPRVPGLLDALVTGYRQVAPLSAEDEAEIPTFVLLRRLQLVAWVGSHPFADAALELGAEFTAGACELAESYLSSFG